MRKLNVIYHCSIYPLHLPIAVERELFEGSLSWAEVADGYRGKKPLNASPQRVVESHADIVADYKEADTYRKTLLANQLGVFQISIDRFARRALRTGASFTELLAKGHITKKQLSKYPVIDRNIPTATALFILKP